MLKTFLLAAGRGERLRPLTDTTPKCLVPIRGVPLMEYWFRLFEQHGITEVLVNLHYLADKVQEYLGARVEEGKRAEGQEFRGSGGQEFRVERSTSNVQRSGFNGDRQDAEERLRITTVYEPELLGSAGTLWVNRSFIAPGEDFFICYADNLTNVDLSHLMDFHRTHELPLTMGLFRASEPHRCGIAELDGTGTVISFEEKPQHPKSDLANAGIYVARASLFDFIPQKTPADIGFDVLPRLVGQMKGCLIRGELLDIGTPESYEKAQEFRG